MRDMRGPREVASGISVPERGLSQRSKWTLPGSIITLAEETLRGEWMRSYKRPGTRGQHHLSAKQARDTYIPCYFYCSFYNLLCIWSISFLFHQVARGGYQTEALCWTVDYKEVSVVVCKINSLIIIQ
jgi:hypothetical protein